MRSQNIFRFGSFFVVKTKTNEGKTVQPFCSASISGGPAEPVGIFPRPSAVDRSMLSFLHFDLLEIRSVEDEPVGSAAFPPLLVDLFDFVQRKFVAADLQTEDDGTGNSSRSTCPRFHSFAFVPPMSSNAARPARWRRSRRRRRRRGDLSRH